MIYFVTGGAGFIGSNFINYMFKKYGSMIEIINIDSLTYAGSLSNLQDLDPIYCNNKNYKFENIDITNQYLINQLFNKYHPDYVINFAAETHVDRSIEDPSIFIKTNVLGTQVLLDAAFNNGVKRFHQISTDEVYGSLGDEGYFLETTQIDPHSPYSASKASADLICKAYFDTYKMPVTISRCSNNYGPFQNPEKLIPLMIYNILNGKPLPVYGRGENIRDWLYVEDHCSAIDLIIHKAENGSIYNIGSNNEWRNIDIVKMLINKIRRMLPIEDKRLVRITEELITFTEDRKGHDWRYGINSLKIREELGWTPKTSFEEGINNTICWYLEHLPWVEAIIKN